MRPHTCLARRCAGAWIFACLLIWFLLLPHAAFALVGPAREAPELEPYAVMVLNREGGSASFCTASVIARDVVLTAAHCVTSPEDTRIHFRDDRGRPVLRDVAAIAINPGFREDAARRRLLSIDLALVRLAEPLPSRFSPVEIARSDQASLGRKLRIAGFGIAEEGSAQTGGVLRSGLVVANGPRSSVLLWLRDPDGTGLGACTGDSGAPVLAANGPELVAVAVWARGEGEQRCGALTQAVLVAPQRPWIERVLEAWDMAGASRP